MPCDYICFTDDQALANPGNWKIIHAPRLPEEHPRMSAKFFKILNHRIFQRGRLSYARSFFQKLFAPRYDYTVWIDGSIQVKSAQFVREFVQQVGPSGWSMFVHPDRNCIYPEAEFSRTMAKYQSQPIVAQIEAYRAEGYPAGNGLIAPGLTARSTAVDLSAIEEMWWQENLRRSYQDQLSLPVVLWRLRRSYDPVRKNLWSNEWFDWIPHRRDD
jgi:hypothetical protein